jgi:hypothetical protein
MGLNDIINPPPKPWPQTGLALGAIHIQRNWTAISSGRN